jgi:two-component system, OmpR family, sensor kinase
MSDAEHLAVVVHELRSPVAALAALVEAAPAIRDPDGRRRLVQLAVAAARDVERILVDPELFSLQLEQVDVGVLVSSFADDRVSVRVDGRPRATADPTRLRQAIANLVANGLRHGSHVAIEVAERDGAGIVVEVADDGPGIDPRIDPFARGVSGAGSSGIGLWLARAVAEAHGGSLEVVPGSEGGARFRLALRPASDAG